MGKKYPYALVGVNFFSQASLRDSRNWIGYAFQRYWICNYIRQYRANGFNFFKQLIISEFQNLSKAILSMFGKFFPILLRMVLYIALEIVQYGLPALLL
jgi:hypothetical protein